MVEYAARIKHARSVITEASEHPRILDNSFVESYAVARRELTAMPKAFKQDRVLKGLLKE
jgi:hypothetical protein